MKVVVGQNTIVKKITVGTPLRVGSAANGSLTGLDDVNGTNNLANGTILQFVQYGYMVLYDVLSN